MCRLTIKKYIFFEAGKWQTKWFCVRSFSYSEKIFKTATVTFEYFLTSDIQNCSLFGFKIFYSSFTDFIFGRQKARQTITILILVSMMAFITNIQLLGIACQNIHIIILSILLFKM